MMIAVNYDDSKFCCILIFGNLEKPSDFLIICGLNVTKLHSQLIFKKIVRVKDDH